MERIVIEVDETTAKNWKNSSKKLKSDLGSIISSFLAKALSQNKHDEFSMLIEEVQKEAKANGLTENILSELLREDR